MSVEKLGSVVNCGVGLGLSTETQNKAHWSIGSGQRSHIWGSLKLRLNWEAVPMREQAVIVMFLRVGSGWRLGHRFRFLKGMATLIAPKTKDKIELSDAEDRLCKLLDEFTRHLKSEDGIVTACRINGGWVRDKVNP